MGETFYFCSKNCVKQFDANPHQYAHPFNEQAGSATTGFNPDLPIFQFEIPIIGLSREGHPGGQLIRSVLEKTPGIERVIANPIEGIVVVDYNPKIIQILDIVRAIKKTGYQVGGAQKRIGIENVRCASCVGFIENELKKARPGVLNASVSLGGQEATVEYLPEQTSINQLNAAIESWCTKPARVERRTRRPTACSSRKRISTLDAQVLVCSACVNPEINHCLS